MAERFPEIACPLCGGELDDESAACSQCEFRGVRNGRTLDFRLGGSAVQDVDGSLQREREVRTSMTATDSEISPPTGDDGRSAWRLFWPADDVSSVVNIGSYQGAWYGNHPSRARRIYSLHTTLPEPRTTATSTPSLLQIVSAHSPRLPFRPESIDLVSIELPLRSAVAGSRPDFDVGSDVDVHALLKGGEASRPHKTAGLLEEVRRILRPDGTLMLLAPNRNSYQRLSSFSSLARIATSSLGRFVGRSHHTDRSFDDPLALRGYRTLLLNAGFDHISALGLLIAQNRFRSIFPIGNAAPYWKRTRRFRSKATLKSHRWFVPAFGIRASSRPPQGSPLQQIMERLRSDCKGTSELSFESSLVTEKRKVVFFGATAETRLVLKVPLDESARQEESRNWSMLQSGLSISALKAPSPIHQGTADDFAFFVETRVTGHSVYEIVASRGETAAIEDVAQYLERRHAASSLESTKLDKRSLRRLVDEPLDSIATVVGESRSLARIREFLRKSLLGTRAAVGLTHGDLSVSNVVLGNEGVAGVIDWADATRDGLPAIDVIGHLESRIRRARRCAISDSVALVLDGSYDDPAIRDYLERAFADLFVTRQSFASYVYLYWVHHMRVRARGSLERNDGSTRSSLSDAVRQLRLPARG